MSALSQIAPPGGQLTPKQTAELISRACPEDRYRGKKVLLIVPDATRTAPVGLLFQTLHRQIGVATRTFDVLVALGTHPPMSEAAICDRLEISVEERKAAYGRVRFFNHSWNEPKTLQRIGVIPAAEISQLSGGLFSMEVPVEINRLVLDYDQIIIAGPVFPHEVVGFSGGNKYLFPGVSGPEVLNFFHWLGAVVTNPMIIGCKRTPVRAVVDRAASMVQVDKFCFAMVVDGHDFVGLYAGTPEAAWDAASDHSVRCNVTLKEHPFHTILSCVPPMYDEIWTAGKGMYKLEPVLANGGHLIIYGPHIREISMTHGPLITRVGYHCRDYFLKQWDRFKHFPWGVLAHSTHVYGIGEFEDGVETPRARVSLATSIPEEICQKINLGYVNPASIRMEDYGGREEEGVLLVSKAGEKLFRLRQSPKWAGGNANLA